MQRSGSSGPASTEEERPLRNIFIVSDRGLNPTHAVIFSHGNLLSIMGDLKSSKNGRVSQPHNLTAIGKSCSGKSALCERECSPIKLAL